MDKKAILLKAKSDLEHLDYQQRVMEPYSPYTKAVAEELGITLKEKPPIYDMDEIYDEQQHLSTIIGIYDDQDYLGSLGIKRR